MTPTLGGSWKEERVDLSGDIDIDNARKFDVLAKQSVSPLPEPMPAMTHLLRLRAPSFRRISPPHSLSPTASNDDILGALGALKLPTTG